MKFSAFSVALPGMEMQKSRQTGWQFASFKIDLDRRSLLHNDHERPLRPKSFDVLLVLVERSGQAVPINDIVNAVWGQRHLPTPKAQLASASRTSAKHSARTMTGWCKPSLAPATGSRRQ